MNIRKTTVVASLLLFVGTACADLDVENLTAPDTKRALAEPGDVESLIGSAFLTWWNANHSYYGAGMALQTMSEEATSSWGNSGMRELSSLPRVALNNSPSWAYRLVVQWPWYNTYSAIKASYDGLRAINGGLKIVDANGRDNTPRAKAFAKFIQGISHGFLAILFDKAFILDETVDLEQPQQLQPYTAVSAAAEKYLTEAATLAGATAFNTEPSWISGVTLSNTELARLAHSFAARYLASVARSTTERAAVNWQAVISHVDQGVTRDFAPVGDGYQTWFDESKMYQGGFEDWGRMDLQGIGVVDTAGQFAVWYNTAPANRQPFDVQTPDRRVTGAGGPRSPGLYVEYVNYHPFRPERGTYHFSNYWGTRHTDYTDDFEGPMLDLSVREMRLLKAEGLLRRNDRAGAAAIINETRVANGKLFPVGTGTTPPAGMKCVPLRMNAKCGADFLLEALKWEKRIETYHNAVSSWFFDSRGWGDLEKATPIHFPIPGKELQVLQQELYTFGGEGGQGSAPGFNAVADFPTLSAARETGPVSELMESYRAWQLTKAHMDGQKATRR